MPHLPNNRNHAGALLDPYGIYGTRTANRLRSMRRRRRAQQFILALIVLGLIVLGIYSWQTHRIPTLKASGKWSLFISPSATPAWDPQFQDLLIPTNDGQIVATWPLARPMHSRILLETDFPIRNTPVLDEKYFYTGSENGVLYALDRGTGKLIWQYNSGASISTQPQVLRNIIFCGNDEGWLFCLRTNNGKLVWKRKLPSAIGNGLAVVMNPSKLVLAPLADGAAQHGGVWAMDANNGLIKWKFPVRGITNAQQITPPVTVNINGNTRVFCANDTGTLINLNALNGKYGGNDDGWKVYFQNQANPSSQLMLRQPPIFEQQPSPTRLYLVGNDDAVRCVDIYSGHELWEWHSPTMVRKNIQLVNGQLLVTCQGSVSYLLNNNTGEVDATLRGTHFSFASMISVDNHIWAIDNNGTMLRYPLSNP
ncbi:MAG: PQQ-binding-like beta-propeller repeat protein [Abditibacteriaceae bacterium]